MSWRTNETYLRYNGQWNFRCLAAGKSGSTINFVLWARRGQAAVLRYIEKSIVRNGKTRTVKMAASGGDPGKPRAIGRPSSSWPYRDTVVRQQLTVADPVVRHHAR
jgi:hypothetical protein